MAWGCMLLKSVQNSELKRPARRPARILVQPQRVLLSSPVIMPLNILLTGKFSPNWTRQTVQLSCATVHAITGRGSRKQV